MNSVVESARITFFLVILCFFIGCTEDYVVQPEDPSQIRSSQIIGPDAESIDTVVLVGADGGKVQIKRPSTTTNSNGCNLTGRWISTQRTVNVANYDLDLKIYQLGQPVRSWAYWQFTQSGMKIMVRRGLQCGSQMEVIPRIPMASNTSMGTNPKFWEAVTRNNLMAGRTGTYTLTSDSSACQLVIGTGTLVEGATASYFNDPTHPLSEAINAANTNAPGWEDWDGDRSPGVTYRVSGISIGDLYTARREITEYRGNTAKDVNKFKLAVNLKSEHLLISTNPTGVEWPTFKPSPDASDHSIWFARVDGEAQWDLDEAASDLEICTKVRQLASALVPEADN
jgi:hypothetical protein